MVMRNEMPGELFLKLVNTLHDAADEIGKSPADVADHMARVMSVLREQPACA